MSAWGAGTARLTHIAHQRLEYAFEGHDAERPLVFAVVYDPDLPASSSERLEDVFLRVVDRDDDRRSARAFEGSVRTFLLENRPNVLHAHRADHRVEAVNANNPRRKNLSLTRFGRGAVAGRSRGLTFDSAWTKVELNLDVKAVLVNCGRPQSSFLSVRMHKLLWLLAGVLFTGCQHGALKVASGPGGPWIVTADGAIYGHTSSSGWQQKEPPGTADDLALDGVFLIILTKPDSQGVRSIKSRDLYATATPSTWTTYPPLGSIGIRQVESDGGKPVVLTEAPDQRVYRYDSATQAWKMIHEGAKEISVMNGRLFHLYPTTTTGNVWSRDVNGGLYTRWGDTLVAHKIAGDANGYPWVATDTSSNPLYKWDTENQKWTFGFGSGSVFDMDIESYVKLYILSEPQISGGGYTVYSHELYSGGWTKYSLPSY